LRIDEKFFAGSKLTLQRSPHWHDPDVAQFLMQKTGRLGAPQTSINGEWVLGYDPNTASRIINRFKRFS